RVRVFALLDVKLRERIERTECRFVNDRLPVGLDGEVDLPFEFVAATQAGVSDPQRIAILDQRPEYVLCQGDIPGGQQYLGVSYQESRIQLSVGLINRFVCGGGSLVE